MITIGGIQYEPQQRKVYALATSTIVLFAGDMQLHAAVTPKAEERIKEVVGDREPQRLTVKEIAEAYAIEFAFYRRSLAEREILAPRGLDFDRFARQQATLPHYQVRELDAMLAAHAIDATAIIAGVDHTGAHLYKVRDPGAAESFDIPHFVCAGSGKDIAETQFMVAQYDRSWSFPRALWLAFSAKARAQIVGGVGPLTDLVVILPGKIEYSTPTQIDYLFGMFHRVRAKEQDAQNEAVEQLESEFSGASAQASQPASDAAQSAPASPQPKSSGDASSPDEPEGNGPIS